MSARKLSREHDASAAFIVSQRSGTGGSGAIAALAIVGAGGCALASGAAIASASPLAPRPLEDPGVGAPSRGDARLQSSRCRFSRIDVGGSGSAMAAPTSDAGAPAIRPRSEPLGRCDPGQARRSQRVPRDRRDRPPRAKARDRSRLAFRRQALPRRFPRSRDSRSRRRRRRTRRRRPARSIRPVSPAARTTVTARRRRDGRWAATLPADAARTGSDLRQELRRDRADLPRPLHRGDALIAELGTVASRARRSGIGPKGSHSNPSDRNAHDGLAATL